jgi:hypothetical protein
MDEPVLTPVSYQRTHFSQELVIFPIKVSIFPRFPINETGISHSGMAILFLVDRHNQFLKVLGVVVRESLIAQVLK